MPHTTANELASTHNASQLVTVEAAGFASTTASLAVWERRSGCWRLVHGPWRARVGLAGLSDHKREGDGATPTGAYAIGSTVYGIAPDPGVATAYHRLVCGDWWDEDPSSPGYNAFRHVPCGTSPPFGGDSEALWRATVAYQQFAVVEYNVHPSSPAAVRPSSCTTTRATRRRAASACPRRSSCRCSAGCARRRAR